MHEKYNNSIRRLKTIQIVLAIICVVAIVVYILYITKPELTGYVVQDECGPIGGSVMHSIGGEDACKNACNAHCISYKKQYHDSNLQIQDAPLCYNCNCICEG